MSSGGELYSCPGRLTTTSDICPLAEITASNCAPVPDLNVTLGSLLKLTTSDTPYPTPVLVSWIEVTCPLNIGWTTALKSRPPVEARPTLPRTSTEIGW